MLLSLLFSLSQDMDSLCVGSISKIFIEYIHIGARLLLIVWRTAEKCSLKEHIGDTIDKRYVIVKAREVRNLNNN